MRIIIEDILKTKNLLQNKKILIKYAIYMQSYILNQMLKAKLKKNSASDLKLKLWKKKAIFINLIIGGLKKVT